MSLGQVALQDYKALAQGRGKLESLWKVLMHAQGNGDAQVTETVIGRPYRRLCLYHKTVSRLCDKMRA